MNLLYSPHVINMNIHYLTFMKSFIILVIKNEMKNEANIYDYSIWKKHLTNYKINILLQYYFAIFFNLYASPLSTSLNNLTQLMEEWIMNEYKSYLYADSASSQLMIPYQTIEEYIDSLMNKFVNFHTQSSNEYHLEQYELSRQSPYIQKQYKIKQQCCIMRNAIVYSVINSSNESIILDAIPFYEYYSTVNPNIKEIIENGEECSYLPSKVQYEIYSMQMIFQYIKNV